MSGIASTPYHFWTAWPSLAGQVTSGVPHAPPRYRQGRESKGNRGTGRNNASLVTIFLRSKTNNVAWYTQKLPKERRLSGLARRLGLYALVTAAILGLAGIAWTVNDAIGRHHDRIALKGLNGKPSPVAVTVGSEPLVIPANLIRSPTDRRGGLVTAMDLLVHWPSLDGFSEERAEVFRDGSPRAPLIYVTITEAEAPLDATKRLTEIYSLYFSGPAFPGPGHLVGRHMER